MIEIEGEEGGSGWNQNEAGWMYWDGMGMGRPRRWNARLENKSNGQEMYCQLVFILLIIYQLLL
jgi:hypothetical protein